jgi:hypothetical protein
VPRQRSNTCGHRTHAATGMEGSAGRGAGGARLDVGVDVADGAAVVRRDVRHAALAELVVPHLQARPARGQHARLPRAATQCWRDKGPRAPRAVCGHGCINTMSAGAGAAHSRRGAPPGRTADARPTAYTQRSTTQQQPRGEPTQASAPCRACTWPRRQRSRARGSGPSCRTAAGSGCRPCRCSRRP